MSRELVAAGEANPDQTGPSRRCAPCTGSTPPPTTPVTSNYIGSHPRSPIRCSTRGATRCCRARRTPPRPGRRQSKTRNLLERLRDRDDQVLLFARDLSVPFTNNQAERDVRPTKTQMKISGCHRSETTAKAWLRVRGYISTVRKHGDNVLDALHDAITGNPWKPPLAC